ncbi:hypothetical protein [Streptomyces longispororuber]|uniref:hypothetical protein n=1 Tax=Streptomyces longispororuber TaxID=68230 RepID=UPI0037005323
MAPADQTPTTGIPNADKVIKLALAYGLTVTMKTTQHENRTHYRVRFAIPVPVAHVGTELGRAIAADTLTVLWTKPLGKGARGRFEQATMESSLEPIELRTLRLVTEAVELLGRDSVKFARDAAPLPEDVVDAPHALYVDGVLKIKVVPAANVRRVVSNRRFRGWLIHQDDQGAICCDNRRWVPTDPRHAAAPLQAIDPTDQTKPAMVAPRSERVKVGELKVGDKFVTRCAWTVRAIDGGTFTVVSNEGQEVTQTVPKDTIVLRTRRAPERQHVRVVNGGAPELVSSREALAEINHAMMDGKRDVREMSAARSSARIAYKDPARGTVDLRPAGNGPAQDDRAAALLGAGEHWEQRFNVFGEEPKTQSINRAAALDLVRWAIGEDWQAYRPQDDSGVNLENPTGESSYNLRPTTAENPPVAAPLKDTREADRIRAAGRQAYAYGVRLEAQQAGTNEVIEERARAALLKAGYAEAADGTEGFRFHTTHLAVCVRGVGAEGNDLPLLADTCALDLEDQGWFTAPVNNQGMRLVRLTPPMDQAQGIVEEGKRRSIASAHDQALAENARREAPAAQEPQNLTDWERETLTRTQEAPAAPRDTTADENAAQEPPERPAVDHAPGDLHAVLLATADLMDQDNERTRALYGAPAGICVGTTLGFIRAAVSSLRGDFDTMWPRIAGEQSLAAADAWARVGTELSNRAFGLLFPEGARSRPVTAEEVRAAAERH